MQKGIGSGILRAEKNPTVFITRVGAVPGVLHHFDILQGLVRSCLLHLLFLSSSNPLLSQSTTGTVTNAYWVLPPPTVQWMAEKEKEPMELPWWGKRLVAMRVYLSNSSEHLWLHTNLKQLVSSPIEGQTLALSMVAVSPQRGRKWAGVRAWN